MTAVLAALYYYAVKLKKQLLASIWLRQLASSLAASVLMMMVFSAFQRVDPAFFKVDDRHMLVTYLIHVDYMVIPPIVPSFVVPARGTLVPLAGACLSDATATLRVIQSHPRWTIQTMDEHGLDRLYGGDDIHLKYVTTTTTKQKQQQSLMGFVQDMDDGSYVVEFIGTKEFSAITTASDEVIGSLVVTFTAHHPSSCGNDDESLAPPEAVTRTHVVQNVPLPPIKRILET